MMNSEEIKLLNLAKKWDNILNLIGLCAVKEIGRDVDKVRFIPSPIRFAYCLWVLLLMISFLIFRIIFYHKNVLQQETPGMNTLSVTVTYGVSILPILLIIASLIQNKNYGVVQEHVLNLERRLPSEKGKKVLIIRSVIFFISSFTVIIGSIIFDVLTRQKKKGISFEMISNIVAGYAFLGYNMVTVALFATLQLWTQSYFLRINDELLNCSMVKKNKEKVPILLGSKKSVILVEDLWNKVAPTKVEQRILHNMGNSKYHILKESNLVQDIKRLKLLYNDIFKFTREFEAVFSSRCLISVFANLFMATVMLFYSLKLIADFVQKPEEFLKYQIFTNLKNCFICLSSIMGFVWPSGGTFKEAGKTALIIQDNLVHVQHDELKTELKDFALQVQQEKVYFSPYGLFDLENKMLVSILASITSYLVILIQFFPMNKMVVN